jgi:RAB protein geranylgeranyltransferase component A
VGFFEKRRLAKFSKYLQDYEADKPATHQVETLNPEP